MKSSFLIFFLFAATVSFATNSPEEISISSSFATVAIQDNNKTVVITFCDAVSSAYHSKIDIERIRDLAYKKRIMQYFGGLLVNDTYEFKKLVIVVNGERHTYRWNRQNVSMIVNKMCQKAEAPQVLSSTTPVNGD